MKARLIRLALERLRLVTLLATLLLSLGLNLIATNHASKLSLNPVEESWSQQKIQMFTHRNPDPRIWIAGVDEESYTKGAFDRAAHAQVLRNLKRAGARAVFYDLLFEEERDPEVDADLAAALEETHLAVLAGAFQKASDQTLLAPKLMPSLDPVLADGSALMGFINVQDEGTVSAAPVSIGLPEGGSIVYYPSAALAMLARCNSILPSEVTYQPSRLMAYPQTIPTMVATQSVLAADGQLEPLEWRRVPIPYHPPATGPGRAPGAGTFHVVPYWRLVDPDDPVFTELQDAIIFVGENTRKDTDLIRTPVGRMKGVEVQAQLFNTLLSGPYIRHYEFDSSSLSRALDPRQRPAQLNLLLAELAALGLAWVMLNQLRVIRSLLAAAVALLGFVGLNCLVFAFGFDLELMPWIIGWLTAVMAVLVARFFSSTQFLGQFIPKEVVAQLLAGRVSEGEVTATVIVTDIRGYTTLSESKTPLQILSMLNEYHTETVSIYHRYGGDVLNYQGDAQIVLFGGPHKKLKDPAGAAVKAALETAKVVTDLRVRWGIANKENFDVGAGVCTGPVAVGLLGGQNLEFTVIGETVRKCHKVQSLSTALNSNVLLDEATYDACQSQLPVERVDNVQLDGIAYPVTLYRTLDTASPK